MESKGKVQSESSTIKPKLDAGTFTRLEVKQTSESRISDRLNYNRQRTTHEPNYKTQSRKVTEVD